MDNKHAKVKIVITGATGFIGRRLITILSQVKKKEEILCLVYEKCDNEKEKTGRQNLEKLGISYIPVNLVTGSGLQDVPKSPVLVFHLASITDTSVPDHRINDLGTKNLFEAMTPIGPNTHFIFTSSIALHDDRLDYSIPITESSMVPERPFNEYGRRKLLAEKYLRKKARQVNVCLSIIRVCGVFGDGVRKGGLFDIVHHLALRQSWISRVNWPGKISIINVDDMARFIYLISETHPEPGDNNLYIPCVEALTLAEMSKIIHEANGLTYRPINIPDAFWKFLSFFARRKGIFEGMMPHRLYNKIWQAFVLVNNEFWNISETLYQISPDLKPITFNDFYKRCK